MPNPKLEDAEPVPYEVRKTYLWAIVPAFMELLAFGSNLAARTSLVLIKFDIAANKASFTTNLPAQCQSIHKSSNMKFTVSMCKDEDFGEMMPMMFGTMGGQSQFVNAVWPHNLTKEGQEKHRQGFLHMKSIDPSQRWLKAVDDETGKIVGVAEWLVYDGPKPPEVDMDGPADYWDTQDDKEWTQALFRSFMEDRRKVLREATGPVLCRCRQFPYLYLDMLTSSRPFYLSCDA